MAAGWSFAGLLIFVTVWTVMMVAMMLPAAAPMILIFASAQARRDRHVAVPTWIFVAGYMLVWAAAGLGAYVLDQAFTELVELSSFTRPRHLGAPRAGDHADLRRALPVHAAQARLSPPVPVPLGFCSAVLARGSYRCGQHGSAARPVLPWLLLGPVRCANGCRDDEYRLDAFAYAGGIRGKGVPVWGAYLSCSGGGVNRYRIANCKWRPSTPLACLSSNSHRIKGGRPRLNAC